MVGTKPVSKRKVGGDAPSLKPFSRMVPTSSKEIIIKKIVVSFTDWHVLFTGDGWVTNLDELRRLTEFADNSNFLSAVLKVKQVCAQMVNNKCSDFHCYIWDRSMEVFNPPCSLLFQLIDHDLSPWRAWILENWYQMHFMSTVKCYRHIHPQWLQWQRLLSGCALCFSTCFQILTLRFHEFNAVVTSIEIQQSVTRLSKRRSVLPVDIHVDRVWVNLTPLHLRFYFLLWCLILLYWLSFHFVMTGEQIEVYGVC